MTDDSRGARSISLSDPVKVVTVEYGRREMRLSQLGELQNGMVIELGTIAPDRVTLCADGTPIAEGRLVELNGQIGMQITRIR